MRLPVLWLTYTLFAPFQFAAVHSLRPSALLSRRAAIVSALFPVVSIAAADERQEDGGGIPDRFDVDNFIRTGVVANPMGVSGQAGTLLRRVIAAPTTSARTPRLSHQRQLLGKSRPETGV